jgi:hypothetical protein
MPPVSAPFPDRLKAWMPVISLVVSLAVALGFLTNPVSALNSRIAAVERTVSAQEQAIADVRVYARAAAIDLCLTRPDTVLARMDLNCRVLVPNLSR